MAGLHSDIWIDYGSTSPAAGAPTQPRRAMAVSMVDGSGNEVGGFGTAATPTPGATAASTDTQVSTAVAGLRLMGFSAKADATSTFAEFQFCNGTTAAQANLIWGPVTLNPGESTGMWFGPNGIGCAAGLFLDRVTGLTNVVPITVVAV